ncbi:7998_t:CDS:2, partial [Ambispora leptoticha]
TTNQIASIEQLNDIWNVPEYSYDSFTDSESKNASMSPQSELSSGEFSLMQMEPFATNNMLLSIENDILQEMSDESNLEDYRDALVDNISQQSPPKSVKSNLDDYEEALFDDVFNDLYHPQTIEWANNAY